MNFDSTAGYMPPVLLITKNTILRFHIDLSVLTRIKAVRSERVEKQHNDFIT